MQALSISFEIWVVPIKRVRLGAGYAGFLTKERLEFLAIRSNSGLSASSSASSPEGLAKAVARPLAAVPAARAAAAMAGVPVSRARRDVVV
jgi:hypothetical protein